MRCSSGAPADNQALVLYPEESGFRKSGGDSSIVGVTRSHADNMHGSITLTNRLPAAITEHTLAF
jgi:hypothetical protein